MVEELLSGITRPAQLSRRYNLSRGLVYHWKNQYAKGKLNNEPDQEEALIDRINKLEQMLGKLTLENEFLKKALQMALRERDPLSGCIHHSDQGVQYASSEYVNELKRYHFQISMSRKGNPYENATCESFIKTLKDEEVYLWEYRTIEDAEKRISHFIRDVYNEKRLHSSLGYRPPNEFEELMTETQKPTIPCQSVPG